MIMRRIVGKFLKDLALIDAPIALQMRAPLGRRQGAQTVDIARIRFHQHLVIKNRSADKAVILRPLALFIAAINE